MIDTFSSYSEGEESYDEWKEDQSPEAKPALRSRLNKINQETLAEL